MEYWTVSVYLFFEPHLSTHQSSHVVFNYILVFLVFFDCVGISFCEIENLCFFFVTKAWLSRAGLPADSVQQYTPLFVALKCDANEIAEMKTSSLMANGVAEADAVKNSKFKKKKSQNPITQIIISKQHLLYPLSCRYFCLLYIFIFCYYFFNLLLFVVGFSEKNYFFFGFERFVFSLRVFIFFFCFLCCSYCPQLHMSF